MLPENHSLFTSLDKKTNSLNTVTEVLEKKNNKQAITATKKNPKAKKKYNLKEELFSYLRSPGLSYINCEVYLTDVNYIPGNTYAINPFEFLTNFTNKVSFDDMLEKESEFLANLCFNKDFNCSLVSLDKAIKKENQFDFFNFLEEYAFDACSNCYEYEDLNNLKSDYHYLIPEGGFQLK